MAQLTDREKDDCVTSTQTSSSPSFSRDSDLIAQTRVERVFNTIQFFALSITFMSSWEAIAGNLYTVFYNGGPQTLVWGFLLVWVGALAQAASLAEMASVQPIAGAMYVSTIQLALQLRAKICYLGLWLIHIPPALDICFGSLRHQTLRNLAARLDHMGRLDFDDSRYRQLHCLLDYQLDTAQLRRLCGKAVAHYAHDLGDAAYHDLDQPLQIRQACALD